MERKMEKKSLVVALKDFFGYREGQNAGDFMREVKALTDEDRAFFQQEFAKIGIETGV